MTDHSLVCWQCGADISGLPLPLGRRSECPECHAELHVCRMCRHFDTSKAKQCREPMAEEVLNKTRANFCDWLQVKTNAYHPSVAQSSQRKSLAALFGDPDDNTAQGDAKSDLDRLFGK